MSRADKSHVPYVSGVQHPFHAAAKVLVDNGAFLAQVRRLVQAEGRKITPSLPDIAHARSLLEKTGDLQKLRDVLKAALAKEKPTKTLVPMPRPPPAAELYGRVIKHTPVLDVGSGDARRLIQFEGQIEVTTQDPKVSKTRIDAPHIEAAFEEPSEQVVTHFLSMTNNEKQDAFINSDGVGVCPDVHKLEKYGMAIRSPDGSYGSTGGGKDWVDYPCQVPGTPIAGFYLGVNTYKERTIKIRSREKIVMKAPELQSIGRRVVALPGRPEDCSLKYRGYQWKFRKKGEKSALVDRAGNVYLAWTDLEFDMDFDFEMTSRGPRLIRLNIYRGFRPFHSLAALSYFLTRVTVELDGQNLLCPEQFHIHRPEDLLRDDVEGVVFRVNGEDHLIRRCQAFDIRSKDLNLLMEQLEESGLEVVDVWQHLGEPDEVVEYEVEVKGTTCELRFCGIRDKRSVDNLANVINKLSWPTVAEFLTLYDPEKYDPFVFSKEELDDEPDTDDE